MTRKSINFADLNQKDLQIVLLESPNETLLTPLGKLLFANIMELRIKGYTSIHTEGILPLDTSDFIATHLLVCHKNDPFNNVIMCYKSTPYSICDKFNIPFPLQAILERSAHPNCASELKKVLDFCRANNQELSYPAGWTMDTRVKENKELQIILKEMVTTFVINYHRDFNIPHWATLGICKVKTDQYFMKMGLREISDRPMLSHPYLLGTDARAVIVMNHEYSDYTFQTCKRYQNLWDEKIIISKTNQYPTKIAA